MQLPRLLDNTADTRRDVMMWGVLAALVIVQVAAFWMLCTHQVRKAQERDAAIQSQRMAVADCLQYLPGATLATCASGAADRVMRAHAPAPADAGGVMTLGFSR